MNNGTWTWKILDYLSGPGLTCSNLPDSDWFYYNQSGMLLEKSENVLKLAV